MTEQEQKQRQIYRIEKTIEKLEAEKADKKTINYFKRELKEVLKKG